MLAPQGFRPARRGELLVPPDTGTLRPGQSCDGLESSNEFGPVVGFQGRLADTSVRLLPPGSAGSKPTCDWMGPLHLGILQESRSCMALRSVGDVKDMQTKLALAGNRPTPRFRFEQCRIRGVAGGATCTR